MAAPPVDAVEGLERLAARAPVAGTDPDELWARGRRRQRRQWAVVVASAVVLAGVGAWGLPATLRLTDAPVAPAADSSDLVLPDVVREPGGWEPAFPRDPGPLVAVGAGTRSGWFSERGAWWGVSGTTGESRFLDLPGASYDVTAEPVLSPDGARLAYWITGSTPETLPDPDGLRPEGEESIVGVAVLDLLSGTVRRWETDTPRGKSANGMAWAGDVLWWSSGDYEEGSTVGSASYRIVNRTWDLATGERSEARAGTPEARLSLTSVGVAPGGFLVATPAGMRAVTSDGVGRVLRFDRDLLHGGASLVSVSPDARRIAGIDQPDPEVHDDSPQAVVVGDLPPDRVDAGITTLEEVGSERAHGLLGWRSDHEVVVLTQEGSPDWRRGASVVDVATGERHALVAFRGNVPDFAAQAWNGAVVDAPDPPFSPDPRLVAFLLGLTLVVGASVWRRVRGRRGHP